MKKDAIIFGAGNWGQLAFFYYKEKCNILCYVDNNCDLWGKEINGIKINSPEILKNANVTVIIANKKHCSLIKKQLLDEYKKDEVIIFEVSEVPEILQKEKQKEDEMIVSFSGGLGNQMFQYALYLYLKENRLNVAADLSHYILFEVMPFQLENVFKKIRLRRCSTQLKNKYLGNEKLQIIEEGIENNTRNFMKIDITSSSIGYIRGFFQTPYYADMVKAELLKDFSFDLPNDVHLQEILQQIESKNSVSVHVRRGDYLKAKAQIIFGNICTENYYVKAFDIIEKNVKDPFYVFFSDDINWVQSKLRKKNAIYINSKDFEEYQDWYDMYLMSKCQNNIICNSTFSWWGAWLNQNSRKLVIAPNKWVNYDSLNDICPPEWIRI